MTQQEINSTLDDLIQECREFATFEPDHSWWSFRADALESARAGHMTEDDAYILRDYLRENERLSALMSGSSGDEADIYNANRAAAEALASVLKVTS